MHTILPDLARDLEIAQRDVAEAEALAAVMSKRVRLAHDVLDLADQGASAVDEHGRELPPPVEEVADLWAFALGHRRASGAPWPGRARHMRAALASMFGGIGRGWAAYARRCNALAKDLYLLGVST